MLPWLDATVALAVTVDPFNPKETLFEFENTRDARPLLVVPAEKVTFPAAGLGPEMMKLPAEYPTEMAPDPKMLNDLASSVVELDCP